LYVRNAGMSPPSGWAGALPASSGIRLWKRYSSEAMIATELDVMVHSRPEALKEISLQDEERYTTDLEELDHVLGGGIVKGSLILIGGDPGLENRPCCFRCVTLWLIGMEQCSTFRARNPSSR